MTHLSPTLSAVFLLGTPLWMRFISLLLGMFWEMANGPGAVIGMICGFFVGVIRYFFSLDFRFSSSRLILYFSYQQSVCQDDATSVGLFWALCGDFNIFAIFLFLFVCLITMLASFSAQKFGYFIVIILL